MMLAYSASKNDTAAKIWQIVHLKPDETETCRKTTAATVTTQAI